MRGKESIYLPYSTSVTLLFPGFRSARQDHVLCLSGLLLGRLRLLSSSAPRCGFSSCPEPQHTHPRSSFSSYTLTFQLQAVFDVPPPHSHLKGKVLQMPFHAIHIFAGSYLDIKSSKAVGLGSTSSLYVACPAALLSSPRGVRCHANRHCLAFSFFRSGKDMHAYTAVLSRLRATPPPPPVPSM